VSETACSYVVPIRWDDGDQRASLASYLAGLSESGVEVLVVDGSTGAVFDGNAEAFMGVAAHLRPAAEDRCLNGKVTGVRTGVRRASRDRVVIADDDVRYDAEGLERTVRLLDDHALVRPQNYFRPLPWHARWDTARTLLNRSFGRDFPGTLAVRRAETMAMGYYDGDVLFENLELIRTVRAHGGRIAAPLDLYVARLPPTASHFWGQRVRQAYDDLALPRRMALWLAIPPLLGLGLAGKRTWALATGAGLSILAAERGRRRAGGRAVFPPGASLLAPVWLLERGLCAWAAVANRLLWGGVRYRGSVIRTAAHSERTLRERQRPRPGVDRAG
jgi:Glycosyltransferase like family 2